MRVPRIGCRTLFCGYAHRREDGVQHHWLVTRWLFIAILLLVTPKTTGAEDDQSGSITFDRLGAAIGLRQYYSDTWGIVGLDLENPRDEAAEVLAVFGFTPDAERQYARVIRLPPRTIRRTWAPLRLPSVNKTDNKVDLFSMLIDRRNGRETVLRRSDETVQHETYLRIVHDRPVTGIIIPDPEFDDPVAEHFAYEAVVALRAEQRMGRQMALISDRRLPAMAEAWDGLDQLVIYDDRFADDTAAMAAIRAWLIDGGRLWIMLDCVSFEGVERLLGDAFACQLVDRVELNETEIIPDLTQPAGAYEGKQEFERPVRLARIVPGDGMQVTHRVGGWPAAFRRDIGRGQVVFTTLGMEAWLQRRRLASRYFDPNSYTDFEPTQQLQELNLLRSRESSLPAAVDWQPYLAEQIGYRIVPRRYVVATLASFCGLLIVAALWMSRQRSIARMGWIAPGAALAAAAPLLWQGFSAKQTVPPTLAQAQVIEISDGSAHAAVRGAMALFHPSTEPVSIGADDGGLFEMTGPGAGAIAQRMVWTDRTRWRWEDLRLPAGLRMMQFEQHVALSEPVRAVGTFTSSGFEARLQGPIDAPSDVVIAVPGQPPLAGRCDGSRISTATRDLLAEGQYLAGGIVTDEQRRRQAIYQQLLGLRRDEGKTVRQPTLYGWTDPLDMHFAFPDDIQHVGSSLWAIPLKVESPPMDEPVVIPSPFVRYRSVPGPKGSGVSPLYDYRTGIWVSSVTSSEIWLQFQVPPEVLPFRPERAHFALQITASDRHVEICTSVDGQRQVLLERSNPIGRLQVELRDPSQLQIDDAGTLVLGMIVSDLRGVASERRHAMWKVESAQLEISGRRTSQVGPAAANRSPGDRNE